MSQFLFPAALALLLLVIFRKNIREDIQFAKEKPQLWMKVKWKNWGEPLLIAAVLAILIRTFLVAPYKIPTGSMIPTLQIGDKIFVNKIHYRFEGPERGDIVVFKYPKDKKKDYVKRLIGLPGEFVEIRNGTVLIDGNPLTEEPFSNVYYYNVEGWDYGAAGQVIQVPPGHYFVLGDNSSSSSDSRNWGFVPASNMVGKASLVWWPPRRIRLLRDQ